jgi:hypothetical protein
MAHDHDALRRALKQSGGVDGLKVIDGPRPEGWPKINISLDMEDAWALMKFLRRN